MILFARPRPATILLILLALALGLPALAAKGEKSDGEFEMESRLLSQDPEIRDALWSARRAGDDPVPWNDLGLALADRGAFADSIRAFERAIDLDPENEDYLNNRGASWLKMGRIRKALGTFEKALKLEPFNARTYYNLGVAHDKLGHYDKALKAYESAFQLDPDLADPEKNPGVVNNEHIMAIRLRVYGQTAGSNPAIYHADEVEEDEAP